MLNPKITILVSILIREKSLLLENIKVDIQSSMNITFHFKSSRLENWNPNGMISNRTWCWLTFYGDFLHNKTSNLRILFYVKWRKSFLSTYQSWHPIVNEHHVPFCTVKSWHWLTFGRHLWGCDLWRFDIKFDVLISTLTFSLL